MQWQNKLRNVFVIMVSVICLNLTVASSVHASEQRSHCSISEKCDFRSGMRKLWEDHITWTRVYIISAVGNLPDQTAAATRLLKNQEDIGDAIKPFYGDAAGAKLTELLKGHILTAVDIIVALKAGNNDDAQVAIKKWYENADEIAVFLNSANPQYWPLEMITKMMHDHLDHTTMEVVARLEQRWDDDVKAYDMIHEQILVMADFLSSGIMKQFPECRL